MALGGIRANERHESIHSYKKKKSSTRKLPIPEGFEAVPPEGGFAWMVLAGIFLVTMMMSIPMAGYSIMLQDIIVTMNASTTITSLGPSLNVAASNFISPLGAVAIHATSCRKTAFFGGILLSLGLILSSFAQNIGTLVSIFGTFVGIGYGLTRISCLVLASHYFHVRFGIAVSAIFTGFPLGRVFFLPLVRICNDKYGVKGTFLILGGLTLNICVGAALFQPARWHYVLRPIVTEDPGANQNSEGEADQGKDVEMIEDERITPMIANNDTITERETEHENLTLLKLPADETVIVPPTHSRRISQVMFKSENEEGGPPKPRRRMTVTEVVAIRAKSIIGDDITKSLKERKAQLKTEVSWKQKLAGSIDFKLLKEPIFFVILASQVLTNLSIIFGTGFFPTLCLDKGLNKMEAAILPTFRAAAEITGRITLPLQQLLINLDPVVFYIITCFMVGMALLAQALLEGYYSILLTGMSTGFLEGGIIVQTTTLTLISVGKKKLPTTLGLCAFFQGFFILIVGPLIGWVRDTSGNLSNSYLLIAGFQLTCAALWLVRYFCISKSKEETKPNY